jgi:hypothetical protein
LSLLPNTRADFSGQLRGDGWHGTAGETLQETVQAIRELKRRGMGGILDCAVEADVPQRRDNREDAATAREAEDHADNNLTQLLASITAAAQSSSSPTAASSSSSSLRPTASPCSDDPPSVAVKLTALSNPVHLQRAALLITTAAAAAAAAAARHTAPGLPAAHLAARHVGAEAAALLAPVERRLAALAEAAAAEGVALMVRRSQRERERVDALGQPGGIPTHTARDVCLGARSGACLTP